MKRLAFGYLLAGLALPIAARAQTLCQLCDAADARVAAPAALAAERPLRIMIESSLDFSLAAQKPGGPGSLAIDPFSGAARAGGNLVDIAGLTLRAVVRITGEPLRRVRIELPARVEMRSSSGGTALLSDIVADLGASPQLDSAGVLVFSFGGRLQTPGDASGDYRGRIPITADYD